VVGFVHEWFTPGCDADDLCAPQHLAAGWRPPVVSGLPWGRGVRWWRTYGCRWPSLG